MLNSTIHIPAYFEDDIFQLENATLFQVDSHSVIANDLKSFLSQDSKTKMLPLESLLNRIQANRQDVLCPESFSFSDYIPVKSCAYDYEGNWKTFLEVHLDNYHVDPFHPGLSCFSDSLAIKWSVGQGYCAHAVPLRPSFNPKGSDLYKQWHAKSTRLAQLGIPHSGITWLTIYPNIIIEWYPHILVVSKIWPKSPTCYANTCEFYCHQKAMAIEPDLPTIAIAAFQETVQEDMEIIRRIEEGRKCLFKQGDDESGPYQSLLEVGIAHFHEYILKNAYGLTNTLSS